jgi:serine O-acetyltransferase
MPHDSIFHRIHKDWRACFERDPAARSWLEVFLCYPGFHAMFWHRFLHPLHRLGVPVLPRLLSQMVRFITGVEIHPGAEIGAGMFIDHGMGVVIGETAEVGVDCTLYQGVTLGGTSLHRGKRHPTLEDRVVAGAGAKIIGAIVIGSDSKIAAGAVVVKSVPPNSTVVGVPGRVVIQDGQRVSHPVDAQVDMPDPEIEDIAAVTARLDALESELRRIERQQHGTSTL